MAGVFRVGVTRKTAHASAEFGLLGCFQEFGGPKGFLMYCSDAF